MMRSIHRRAACTAALGVLAGVSAAQTKLSFAQTDALVERWIETERVVGAVAVVERDGRRIYQNATGLRDREANAPVRLDTIFRIYSMTKPVTCAAALILCDEGKLDLDDPVSVHLPSFSGLEVGVEDVESTTGKVVLHRVPCVRPMTVRDLMRHTSGLTYGFFAESEVDRAVARANPLSPRHDLARMVGILSTLPLKHQPGARWEYGLSTDVLGRIIEVVAKTTLADFMKKRIFEPLGMADTGFSVSPANRDRLAELYEVRAGDLEVRKAELLGPDPTVLPKLLSGGGGLYSTADDFLRFTTMLLGDGELEGVRVLRGESVAAMGTNQLTGQGAGGMAAGLLGSGGFGLGVAVTTKGPQAGAFHWGGAAGTLFWVDPQNQITGVFMIQNWMQLGYAQAFEREVYRSLPR